MSSELDKERELELYAMQVTLGTEIGRAFMYRCLVSAGVFSSSFDSDPLKTAYNCGHRDQGLWLQNELQEASPDRYLQMIKENQHGQ